MSCYFLGIESYLGRPSIFGLSQRSSELRPRLVSFSDKQVSEDDATLPMTSKATVADDDTVAEVKDITDTLTVSCTPTNSSLSGSDTFVSDTSRDDGTNVDPVTLPLPAPKPATPVGATDGDNSSAHTGSVDDGASVSQTVGLSTASSNFADSFGTTATEFDDDSTSFPTGQLTPSSDGSRTTASFDVDDSIHSPSKLAPTATDANKDFDAPPN